jgi:hypothetical protein
VKPVTNMVTAVQRSPFFVVRCKNAAAALFRRIDGPSLAQRARRQPLGSSTSGGASRQRATSGPARTPATTSGRNRVTARMIVQICSRCDAERRLVGLELFVPPQAEDRPPAEALADDDDGDQDDHDHWASPRRSNRLFGLVSGGGLRNAHGFVGCGQSLRREQLMALTRSQSRMTSL